MQISLINTFEITGYETVKPTNFNMKEMYFRVIISLKNLNIE